MSSIPNIQSPPKPSTPGQTSAILSTATIAASLNVPELWAYRLIARGRIPGTEVGKGSLVILPEALAEYVKGGAPDLTPPTMRGGWFDPNETFPADQFPNQLMKVVDGKWPADAEAQKKYDQDQATSYTIAIPLSEASSVIRAPVPKSILPNQPPSRFGSMGEIYLAKVWRDAVARELGNGNPLARLYRSPSDYRSILDSTWSKLMRDGVSRTKTYHPKKKIAAHGTDIVSVKLSLPLSTLAAGIDKSKLERLTF